MGIVTDTLTASLGYECCHGQTNGLSACPNLRIKKKTRILEENLNENIITSCVKGITPASQRDALSTSRGDGTDKID